ncbi:MAG: prephenate dehydratase [Clostridiales bacterium]|nr:MAG: prephenate dehydratase [Clostridiales bacterium]
MNLSSLREQIDRIDTELLMLFEQRMQIVRDVAQYKKEQHLPIFHPERENQIIERVAEKSPKELANCSKVLFTTLMELSKIQQKRQIAELGPVVKQIQEVLAQPEAAGSSCPKIACQGTEGAYSHIAASTLFPDGDVTFYREFEDVFEAVQRGDVACGLLPVDNSNAGSVAPVYSLMKKYDFFINHGIKVKVEHCLAAKSGTRLERVKKVYSHEQALRQCSGWFERHPDKQPCEYPNTAMAARFVRDSSEPAAAISSVLAAERYGLEILERGIQNTEENYTRFMCISKQMQLHKDADMVSIAVAIPNQPNSLYRLLTVFAAAGVDMTKIESKPIGNKNFDVIFYIDLVGNLRNPEVLALISHLESEYDAFKFLGNYKEIDG